MVPLLQGPWPVWPCRMRRQAGGRLGAGGWASGEVGCGSSGPAAGPGPCLAASASASRWGQQGSRAPPLPTQRRRTPEFPAPTSDSTREEGSDVSSRLVCGLEKA